MCDLNKRYSHKKQVPVTAYKVVAKRDGKYYSVSMGCEYPNLGEWGKVPIVTHQVRLTGYFNDNILDPSEIAGYRKEMVGRTAGFVPISVKKAVEICNCCRTLLNSDHSFSFILVKVELRKSLLIGFYRTATVVAGREMKIVEEVDANTIT